jgi:transcriptional regulator with XRE-family HTH domain
MTAAAAPWVEAGPFRAHLRHVMAVGDLSATEVATLAGVSPRMAASLLTGRGGRPVRRISPDTARSLLRVTAADARAVRTRQVPAEESRLRVRRLLLRGTDLADRLGVTAEAVATLASGTSGWCSALLALRLLALARAATAGERTADPAARVAA